MTAKLRSETGFFLSPSDYNVPYSLRESVYSIEAYLKEKVEEVLAAPLETAERSLNTLLDSGRKREIAETRARFSDEQMAAIQTFFLDELVSQFYTDKPEHRLKDELDEDESRALVHEIAAIAKGVNFHGWHKDEEERERRDRALEKLSELPYTLQHQFGAMVQHGIEQCIAETLTTPNDLKQRQAYTAARKNAEVALPYLEQIGLSKYYGRVPTVLRRIDERSLYDPVNKDNHPVWMIVSQSLTYRDVMGENQVEDAKAAYEEQLIDHVLTTTPRQKEELGSALYDFDDPKAAVYNIVNAWRELVFLVDIH